MPSTSGETVWILPRQDGPTNAHGNTVHTWPLHTDALAVPVKGAKVAPRTDLAGEASIAGREAVVTGMRVLIPGGAPRPAPVDRMFVRGETYAVIGEPGSWVNPWRQVETGVDVALKRVEG